LGIADSRRLVTFIKAGRLLERCHCLAALGRHCALNAALANASRQMVGIRNFEYW
jgi:uncharacterized protein YutE (UPF0331/DUF86 family)